MIDLGTRRSICSAGRYAVAAIRQKQRIHEVGPFVGCRRVEQPKLWPKEVSPRQAIISGVIAEYCRRIKQVLTKIVGVTKRSAGQHSITGRIKSAKHMRHQQY